MKNIRRRMKNVRIRWKAALPAFMGILIGVFTDKHAVGVLAGALPENLAHYVLVASAIAAVFAPAAATNRPPSEPTPPSKGVPPDA